MQNKKFYQYIYPTTFSKVRKTDPEETLIGAYFLFIEINEMPVRSLMVFFDISLPIQKEDTDFTIFQRFLLMHPDNLAIQIEGSILSPETRTPKSASGDTSSPLPFRKKWKTEV